MYIKKYIFKNVLFPYVQACMLFEIKSSQIIVKSKPKSVLI